ncbi:MAG: transferrin-binding protein-like solute binding protein [Rhizobiales bacterium]|nr:transferrin-binding protein-like solute binding protein [Hyphomicrobiales bacterium]
MPTGGTATYAGVYGSNGTTSNWEPPTSNIPDIKIVEPNMTFMSSGTANLTANFGGTAPTISGALTPEHWTWFQDGGWNRYTVSADVTQWADGSVTTNAGAPQHIRPGYFSDQVNISANITGNTFTGTATMAAGGTTSGANPVYGGFFGPTLNEATGVFTVKGTYVDPYGSGTTGIDDRVGYITHSGVFSTNCTGGTGCTP